MYISDTEALNKLKNKCEVFKLPAHQYLNQIMDNSTLFKYCEFLSRYFESNRMLYTMTYYDQSVLCSAGKNSVSFQLSIGHDLFFNVTEISVLAYDSVYSPQNLDNAFCLHEPTVKSLSSQFLTVNSYDEYQDLIKKCLKVNVESYEPVTVFDKHLRIKVGTVDLVKLQKAVTQCIEHVSKVKSKSVDEYITKNYDHLITECLHYLD